MKIGLLHYTMPPVIGGVERILAAHARLFREGGHEVVGLHDGRRTVAATEFPTMVVPGFGNAGEGMENRDLFVQFIARQKLDVLFAHNVLTMPFCPVATAACHILAATDLPVVSWVHDLAATNPYYAIPADDVLRRHPAGARVVAISQERAEAYRAMTGYADVKVIPNGLDIFSELAGELLERRPELRRQLSGAFPILFHPTRLLRRKNIALGIRVVAELKKLGHAPRLLISGAHEPFSGDQEVYRQELDTLIAGLHLQSNVLFLADKTPLAESDVAGFYQLSDALFFPSEQEGFGLPMLEAGLRGLPIFASETQPLSALAAQNGCVFPPDLPPSQLALKIAGFFAHCPSSQIRRVVRRDFDWQSLYPKHILPLLQSLSS